MRVHLSRAIVPALFLAAACARGGKENVTAKGDLQRDLETAASPSGLQLASQSQGYQRARFVSEIEQTNQSVPVPRAPARRRVTRPHHASPVNQDQRTPVAEESATVVETPQPEPQPTTETSVSEAPTVPVVAPRPAPAPVSETGTVASGRGDGMGIPEGIGGVIGVIIRGGAVGDDHCVPRGRRGRGGGIFINDIGRQLLPRIRVQR